MSQARGDYEPDIAARTAILSAVGWAVIASSTAALVQFRLVFPDALAGLGFMSYGRLRAVADTFTVFGWLTMAGIAAIFAIVPRVAGARLHNEILGSTVAVWWSAVLLTGSSLLLVGFNQGRPLAELPLGIDAILAVLLLLTAYNAGMTLSRRRESSIYVSGWFLLGGAVWLPIVFVLGNVTILSGTVDWLVQGFYTQGLWWLWLVPIGLGVAYWVVPEASGNALSSRQLASISFWTLALAAGWTGLLGGVWGPAPDYAETTAIAMAFVLLLPVLSATSNLFATARGASTAAGDEWGLRFAGVGLVGLVVWAAGSALAAMRPPSRILELTAFRSGLDHLAVWGVFSAFAFAFVYHLFPRLVGRAWYSRRMASLHFWASVSAAAAGGALLLAQGLAQGEMALAWARAGDLSAHAALVQQVVQSARAFQFLVAVSLEVFAAAQVVLAVNVYMTSRRGDPLHLVQPPPSLVRSAS